MLFDFNSFTTLLQDFVASLQQRTPVLLWLAVLVIGGLLEYLWSATARRVTMGEFTRNVAIGSVYLLAIWAFAGPLEWILGTMRETTGGGWIAGWISGSETVASELCYVVLLVFMIDFFYYWWHRAQHAFGPLWAQHSLHHSDEAFGISTSLRHHFTEIFFQSLLVTVPVALLLEPRALSFDALWMLVVTWSWWAHMNVRLRWGPLAVLFTSPQTHRIHHSIEHAHRDKNFGAYTLIWDWLFGTYYAPKREEYPATGVEEALPQRLGPAMAYPFVAWLSAVFMVRRRR